MIKVLFCLFRLSLPLSLYTYVGTYINAHTQLSISSTEPTLSSSRKINLFSYIKAEKLIVLQYYSLSFKMPCVIN